MWKTARVILPEGAEAGHFPARRLVAEIVVGLAACQFVGSDLTWRSWLKSMPCESDAMSHITISKPLSADHLHRLKRRWQRGLAVELCADRVACRLFGVSIPVCRRCHGRLAAGLGASRAVIAISFCGIFELRECAVSHIFF